jgi:acetyltransferase
MDFFFKPRGVALIGATDNRKKGGYAIFKNLLKGFKGGVYPVNPRYQEIEGLTCYPTVLQVPDPVDLAIVFVPAKFVPPIVEECAQRGIAGAMIQSAGFAESGEDGKQLQDKLVEIHKETGIRLWGPNCMGLVDGVNGQIFSFMIPTIWEDGLIPGDVSLIVQSGMLAAGFLIDMMTHGTMGISKACSIGNKVDVNECDVLEYLIGDPDTGTIGLYLESIPEGRRFTDLCRRSDKPIVVLKGGKSEKGAEAAMSHTASLAGNGAVVSGALAQVGVVEAYDFKQMMDLCRALAHYPNISRDKSGRVAILTMSGAAGIVSSDCIEREGLSVADLSAHTVDALKTIFPEWMPIANPIDLYPAAELHGRKKAFGEAFRAVCEDPEVDAILFHFFVFGKVSRDSVVQLAEMAKAKGKLLFCWLMGKQNDARQFQFLTHQMGFPAFGELFRAVECMRAVFSRNLNR